MADAVDEADHALRDADVNAAVYLVASNSPLVWENRLKIHLLVLRRE